MKLFLVVMSAAVVLSVCQPAMCAAKPSLAVKTVQPTKASILELADKYIKEVTPQLTMEESSAVDKIKFTLDSERKTPIFLEQSIDELVNACTIQAASTKGIEAVIATSALLVKYAPANARVTNLFGVVLHTIGSNKEAIAVLEYTRTLKPKSELVMLNTANTYLDLNQDAKCKALIDKVLDQDDKNKSAYSALAVYWFKQGEFRKALEAMFKAAEFGGFEVQKKAEEKDEVVRENICALSDPIETIEEKLAKTNSITPNTAADLIEDQFPDAAQRIRDKYLKLIENEKMIMPPLPQVNTSGIKNWKEKGAPYVNVWAKAFKANADDAMMEVAHLQVGVNKGEGKAAMRAKAIAASKEKTQQYLGNAQKMMKMLENMPGVSKSRLQQVQKRMQQAAAKQGANATATTADSESEDENITIKSDSDLDKYEASLAPPGWDSGSVFALTNYKRYLMLKNNYIFYFMKFFKDYNEKVIDIVKVYGKRAKEENDNHKEKMDKIAQEEKQERDLAKDNNGTVNYEKYQLERRQETLRWHKAINYLSDDYFAQWVNLAFPQYENKMKPKLDEFWAVCALYIRNMNNLEVMKKEYCSVKQMFWLNGGYAVGSMAGGSFTYFPETDEEQQKLDEDIRRSKEEAKSREQEYKNQTRTAADAIKDWMDDNLAIALSGEIMSMKLTPRRLTIEEYIFGMNFKHIYDLKDVTWTTYRSFAAKLDLGFQVGPIKIGPNVRADILETHDTLDIRTGQVVNSGVKWATATASISGGNENVNVGGSATVTIDPAAESEWSVKFTSGMGLSGKLTEHVEAGMDIPGE